MKHHVVSIIIVHYKVKKELFDCIQSIVNVRARTPFEIIVVDNDETKTIKQGVKKRFPFAKYVESFGNVGFGAGNNLGAKHAKGDLLFFLNPDTIVLPHALDTLVRFIKKDEKIGIVAPLLVDTSYVPYPLQGTAELTPFTGICSLSFINKLFPLNLISQRYWIKNWDKKMIKEVGVVPGTAFLIQKSVFEKVGGFDERFFLYFEESDLCKRVGECGYTCYIHPEARVVHLWGASSQKRRDVDRIFSESRFLYFKKHFGVVWAYIVEFFL